MVYASEFTVVVHAKAGMVEWAFGVRFGDD